MEVIDGAAIFRRRFDFVKIDYMANEKNSIKNLLTRNIEEVIEKRHLEDVLRSGKKLRVKLGIDPTSPDLHLGHAVVLRKLKEFEDLGHKIVLIIGDFTARIGDPTGHSETRKPLAEAEIKKNMKEYLTQAGKIIDVKRAEIHKNSDWFKKEGVEKIVELASVASVQQVLRRTDFKKRLEAGDDVSLLEALYPVFQGYDSVKVSSEVELGGTDQTFNLLMGRRVQRHFGMPEQDILTTPLLEGLDGEKKMSKSYGNYIGLSDSPDEMFGKTMSLPDKLMHKYFMLCTDIAEPELKKLEKNISPRDLKARLGSEVVRLYHGEKAAKEAAENFTKVFSLHEVPVDLLIYEPEDDNLTMSGTTVALLRIVEGKDVSNSEARRLIEQGALKINGIVKKNFTEKPKFKGGEEIKLGKHHFFRVKI